MEMKSIITNDLEHCYICGVYGTQIHHCMNAANKAKSEKYGLIVGLCLNHHTGKDGVHTHPEKMLAMRQTAQRKFEAIHGHELWMLEFGKNYI